MRAKFEAASLPAAPNFSFEADLWQCGRQWIAGVDEAGRGAFAGPVAAAGVIFLPERDLADRLSGVRDSKQMTPRARQTWALVIRQAAFTWGVGYASAQEIDALGIVPATRLAMQRALEKLSPQPEHLLVDYLELPEVDAPQTPLVKGDARSLSIAAASILAKTARDAFLLELDDQYPGYGFARHKGYGTAAHRAALESLGPCREHRLSFAPLAAMKEVSR